MVSSVSVDDSIRKRIKKIAAELDTSQGDVVALGVDLLERSLKQLKPRPDHPARQLMRKAIENNPKLQWRKKIRKKLEEPGISIDEVMIVSWSEIDED